MLGLFGVLQSHWTLLRDLLLVEVFLESFLLEIYLQDLFFNKFLPKADRKSIRKTARYLLKVSYSKISLWSPLQISLPKILVKLCSQSCKKPGHSTKPGKEDLQPQFGIRSWCSKWSDLLCEQISQYRICCAVILSYSHHPNGYEFNCTDSESGRSKQFWW